MLQQQNYELRMRGIDGCKRLLCGLLCSRGALVHVFHSVDGCEPLANELTEHRRRSPNIFSTQILQKGMGGFPAI
jgi:hypothetical protein